MRAKNSVRWLAASALMLMAACDSATASGDEARMQMAAAGDDGATTSTTPSGEPRYAQSTADGTVSFAARAYVQTSTGAWVELTDGGYENVAVTASSSAAAARTFASSNVEATSYTRVRIVFRDVNADVQGSLQTGTGFVSGRVTVNAGSDDQIVVERQINVSARAGATTRLLVDLNSYVWLYYASAQAVSEAAFASAVQVSAQ